MALLCCCAVRCRADTGIQTSHPDLAAHMWVNPVEIPGNGIDDDGNGYVDDVCEYLAAHFCPDFVSLLGVSG